MPHLCCSALQDVEESLLESHDAQYLQDLRSSSSGSGAAAGDFALESTGPSYAPNLVIEPIHMIIDLTFDLPNYTAIGSVTHTFKSNHTISSIKGSTPLGSAGGSANHFGAAPSDLLTSVVLNATAMEITSVTGPHVSHHTYDGESLKICWDAPFESGEERKVKVEYKVHKPIAGMYFNIASQAYPDRVTHMITDHETERARYWLPCIDFPAVRTSLDIRLTTPSSYVALGNGELKEVIEHPDSKTKTTVYHLAYRCPSYLISLAVGEYVEYIDESVDDMPIRYYAPKNFPVDDLKRTFGRTPAMVRWLQKKVGYKFPWPKYYQIASCQINGGAMENISLVTYTDLLMLDQRLEKELLYRVDSVNLHEMAHTYFGDLVVMRHFEHVWLKESWATYMQAVWAEDHYSHEDFRFEIINATERYIAETASYMRPIVCRVYDSSWELFDAHTYPGGAVRIHMLRHLLGDELFWKAVQNYVATYAGHYVETEDFKRCLERESGLNLTRFFDQWIYGKGYPKLKATVDFVDAAAFPFANGSNVVQISLEQTQGSKANGIPAVFEMIVEVDIIDVDGHVHTTAVQFNDVTGPRVVSVVPLPKGVKASFVEFDPRGKGVFSLEYTPGEQVLGAMVSQGRDISTRIHAYRELVKMGTISSMKKVSEGLVTEQFWGVRAKAYKALSTATTKLAIDTLAASLYIEKHPRALLELTNSVSAKDDSIRAGLIHLLKQNHELEQQGLRDNDASAGLGYYALAGVYNNLGRQRHPDDLPILLQAAGVDVFEKAVPFVSSAVGRNAQIRQGVFSGLGLHRSQESFEHLLKHVKPGMEHERVQPVAIASLATAADWQDKVGRKKAVEAIAELVRDPQHRVRRAALGALVRLEAKEHTGLLQNSLVTFAKQDVPALEKSLKRLREAGANGAADKVKDLTKAVEDLEARLKKLEAKLLVNEAKEKVAIEAASKESKL
ncbi:hypothetical protein HDV05_003803 [Chytridiales sp. JEL 0842]|nr:hypothetical protein HDV05_003803 [Chytridiales sp. JEL 0842]